MKRDDDYLRELLLSFEGDDKPLVLVSRALSQSAAEQKKNYHIELLCDAGFMTLVPPSGYRMTMQGHDYLDAIRSEGVWQRTKQAVAETGGSATLEILKALATGFVKKKLTEHTGIEL